MLQPGIPSLTVLRFTGAVTIEISFILCFCIGQSSTVSSNWIFDGDSSAFIPSILLKIDPKAISRTIKLFNIQVCNVIGMLTMSNQRSFDSQWISLARLLLWLSIFRSIVQSHRPGQNVGGRYERSYYDYCQGWFAKPSWLYAPIAPSSQTECYIGDRVNYEFIVHSWLLPQIYLRVHWIDCSAIVYTSSNMAISFSCCHFFWKSYF